MVKTLKPTYAIHSIKISEAFKSETVTREIKTPKALGEAHPFDFKVTEAIYKTFGLITGVVDKYVDFTIGPGYYVTSKSKKAETIINQFHQDTNFDNILRDWFKQGLIKGNSPLELGMTGKKIDGLKVLNANYVYIKRDDEGQIKLYRQYIGQVDQYKSANKDGVEFKPNEIAYLTFNRTGDSPYGLGIIYQVLNTINDMLGAQKDMHTLSKRKANSPLHIKVGSLEHDIMPTGPDITAIGTKLEYMENRQEWATGPEIEMKVIDFGNLSDKFQSILDYDMKVLLYSLQVPEVLMGSGSIPEGLAAVQMDAFMRRIQSYQSEIEKVIETQIYKPLLESQGIQEHVEFEWGQPSKTETNEKITKITELLKVMSITPEFHNQLELQLAELMGIDPKDIETAQEEKDAELDTPQPTVPGQSRESVYEYYEGELIH